jgi:transcriptional regulator with XRE-family HTH domain
MPKTARALLQLPPATVAAIEKLGADLAVARLRRKESLKTWAQRMGVSVPTLQRLESGDPGVGIGIVATALWLIQRDGALAQLAAPELDQGAIELDIRQAQALGRARAQASAQSRSSARGPGAKQG